MKFEIGGIVICKLNDNVIFPVIVGKKYKITNITFDNIYGDCYWIDNYEEQYFDEWEFLVIFELDANSKRKEKIEKIEKLIDDKII